MRLKELLKALKGYKIEGSEDTEIFDIQYDSRKVGKGSLFVALKGVNTDGNRFVPDVISRGAVAVVTDFISPYTQSLMERGGIRVAVIQVPNAREAMAMLSAAFYGGPATKLKLVGITGTNGKTTTSFIVESILREAGLNPGVVGTINYRYAGKALPAPNTTPESLDLQGLLRDMVESGVKSAVMEVSSHALSQERVAGCVFDVAVFTNLTQDHLDYHITMERYFEAKSRLFTDFIDEGKTAVINMDDPKGEDLSKRAVGRVIGYGKAGTGKENIYPKDIRLGVDGIKGMLTTPSGDVKINSSLIGEFNLCNILAAVGAAVGLGLPVEAIERGITALKNVPGRLERVDAGQPFTILVDYAHTPDALERVLSTIKELTDKKIITLFGCGGDRDRGKRPIMGRIASEYSDVVIVTSDNPRTEEPLKIIEDITSGMVGATGRSPLQVIPDRREAITEAIKEAKEGDVVLLAGKGHEDYQIIGTEKIHFDDREEAAKAIMKPTWNEIIEAINGKLVSGKPEGTFSGVSTDSRSIKSGELFIALKGESFDGHEFVEKAIEKGACGAIVSGRWSVAGGQKERHTGFIIEVDDTLKALGDMASLWRDKHPIPVVAITGSNGKTTTKEMAALVLSQKYRVLKTEGNLNNLIGLPLTVLKIDDSHDVAVLELGMNTFGEIARLSEICKPDFALITNVGSGHLEGLGSLEGVAKAKGEILEGLKADGTFVVNNDDPYIREIAKKWKGSLVCFGVDSADADVKTLLTDYSCCYGSGMTVSMMVKGKSLTVNLMGLGLHNVYNATAAAAVGIAMGVDPEEIKKGLEGWRPFKGRFELHRLECGVNLIDDTYNANPNSVAMALKTLADVKGAGRGIVILGDMLELGVSASEAHYEIGKKAAATGVDCLFLMGPLSSIHTSRGARDGGMEEGRIVICSDYKDVSRHVNPILTGGDWVLVKGSRGMAMEKVVEGIKNFKSQISNLKFQRG